MILLQACDGTGAVTAHFIFVLPTAVWGEHYWPRIIIRKLSQRAEIPCQVGILTQVFLMPNPVLFMQHFLDEDTSLSLARKDEPRERNAVLETGKENNKSESYKDG